MDTTPNRQSYEKLIAEDRAWLIRHRPALERDHIDDVLAASVGHEYGKDSEPPAGRFEAPADKVSLLFKCDCGAALEWPVTKLDDGTPVCEECDTDMKIGDIVFVSDTVSEAILVGDELSCPHCKGSEFTGWNTATQSWCYYMEDGVVNMGGGDTAASSEMYLNCCGCGKNLTIPADLEANVHYT